jgi:hypothetical protein
MAATKAVAYRLREEDKARLAEMARFGDRTMTDVLSAAINAFFDEKYKPMLEDSQERTRRGLALLEKLEARLGRRFWHERHGVAEVGLRVTGDGNALVFADDCRYFEADPGDLYVARTQGARTEVAQILESGELGGWMPLADPNMN